MVGVAVAVGVQISVVFAAHGNAVGDKIAFVYVQSSVRDGDLFPIEVVQCVALFFNVAAHWYRVEVAIPQSAYRDRVVLALHNA